MTTDFNKFRDAVLSAVITHVDICDEELREAFNGSSALFDKGYYLSGLDVYKEGQKVFTIADSADAADTQVLLRVLEYLGIFEVVDPRLKARWATEN